MRSNSIHQPCLLSGFPVQNKQTNKKAAVLTQSSAQLSIAASNPHLAYSHKRKYLVLKKQSDQASSNMQHMANDIVTSTSSSPVRQESVVGKQAN